MRINAGKFKGFPIATRDVAGTRPTSDKVKQAIFNVLGPAIAGKAVLDLFSGFGSLGLEALSRGARRVVFVEKNPLCTRVITENLLRLHGDLDTKVLTLDVSKAIQNLEKRGEIFDIVLSDAPYSKGSGKHPPQGLNAKLLNALANSCILSQESLLVFQHDKADPLSGNAGRCKFNRSYRHGKSFITIYLNGA